MAVGESDREGAAAFPRTVCHIGLTVPDIDRAVDWYTRVLGFGVLMAPAMIEAQDGHAGRGASSVFGDAFGAMKQAHLTAGNGVGIELFEFLEPKTSPASAEFNYWHVGVFHICICDPDVAGLARRIAETGGKQRTAVTVSFDDEPYRWCYCEDPFGNIIEIYSHSYEQVYANRVPQDERRAPPIDKPESSPSAVGRAQA